MGRQDEEGEVFEGSFDVLRDSTWLSSADLPWDKDTTVQIQEVRRHKNLQLQHEKKSVAGTLVFVGKNKHLLLNAGHRAILKALFVDAKGAQGGWIFLYVDPDVTFGNKIVSAVRIRARRASPPKGAARPAPNGTEPAAAPPAVSVSDAGVPEIPAAAGSPFPDLLARFETAHHTPELEEIVGDVKASAAHLSDEDTATLRKAHKAAQKRIAEYDLEPSYLTDAEMEDPG